MHVHVFSLVRKYNFFHIIATLLNYIHIYYKLLHNTSIRIRRLIRKHGNYYPCAPLAGPPPIHSFSILAPSTPLPTYYSISSGAARGPEHVNHRRLGIGIKTLDASLIDTAEWLRSLRRRRKNVPIRRVSLSPGILFTSPHKRSFRWH